MQLVLIVLTYLLVGIIATGYFSKAENGQPSKEGLFSSGDDLKGVLWKAGTGVGCLLVIDWFSGGHPLWPALGLVAGMAGEVLPVLKGNIRPGRVGIFYFGMVFYMYPGTAIAALGIALPVLLFGEEWFLFLLITTVSIPVLFQFSQVDPLFIWAGTVAGLLGVYHYRNFIWGNLLKKDS